MSQTLRFLQAPNTSDSYYRPFQALTAHFSSVLLIPCTSTHLETTGISQEWVFLKTLSISGHQPRSDIFMTQEALLYMMLGNMLSRTYMIGKGANNVLNYIFFLRAT
jgi:hypothetical protein